MPRRSGPSIIFNGGATYTGGASYTGFDATYTNTGFGSANAVIGSANAVIGSANAVIGSANPDAPFTGGANARFGNRLTLGDITNNRGNIYLT